jgi:hypothetical protein
MEFTSDDIMAIIAIVALSIMLGYTAYKMLQPWPVPKDLWDEPENSPA